ncbi:Eco57I restriction-modification methylase domain-containing protein [Natronoarchaeum sp. GCM10025321]|uniref:Eco57I restriction-modification methylase domain-containing protein n=1 Tax=Natronoarchaeum sp. GCM10025321 TaxID=3252684 RepID=UPI0036118A7C
MPLGFLQSRSGRPWTYDRTDAEFEFYQGEGSSALEIVVVDHGERPNKDFLQRTYTDRRGGRVNPILVVALYDDKVGLCGPSGEDPPVFRDVDRGQAERVCDAALKKPDRHVAQSFLSNTLPQLDEELAGLRNQGLLSTHELRVGVPDRDDWEEATERAQQALTDDPRELVKGLNYEIDRLTDQSYVLKDTSDGHERAVAMFLQEDESFDRKQDRFVNKSPVAYALNEADKRNLDYVIGSSGDTLRLYTTNPEAGFGSRGRTDTYVEVNTNLLADEKAAYLWLLFSANALRDDGALHQIMEDSKEYAADLGGRLRNRIYDDVIPDLAEAIAEARDIDDPTKEELDQTYEMALFLLYRLLFIAYAEDEEFLPRRRNGRYDKHSLKQKAHDLHELVQEGGEFDDSFYDHWDDVMRLSRAIHHGHEEMGLPAYEGRILSEDADVSEAGARLSDIRLNNAEFGPVLFRLLVDETEDGYQGPVDFRNIGVREFGVIYEGLLESELSVAEQPLTTDKDGHYEPVESGGQQTLGDDDEDIVVEEGEVYLHGQSGERKATGTYYTKTRFVEHLLEHSLEPALDDHINRIDRLREEEGENAAAEAFFDIRVSDIAMGSGHFLVGAVDRIETRLRAYLTENQLTPVEEELDNLRDAAEDAFENEEYTPNIEQGQLLRRQVARRCVYGVDMNPLATELARLSIWVHTFVPGLPLTFLDYNLVTGDSLAGIGTLGEVTDILDVEQSSLGMFAGGQSVMGEIRDDISRLGNFADASAEQVQEARETRAEIEEKLEEVRARFDVLSASRIDDDIDTDPISDTGIDITEEECYEKAQNVLETIDPLHFPASFPEVFDGDKSGFDVIVGNPPWEKTQIERHEFWGRYHPGLRGVSQREREDIMDELEEDRPDLAAEFERLKREEEQRGKILTNGPYPGIGKSHPDLYKAFSWRFWSLISDQGSVGVVLPRSGFVGPGMEQFRKEVLDDGIVRDLTFVKNKSGWVFEGVEHRYTIALFSFAKDKSGENKRIPLRGPYPDAQSFEEGVSSDPPTFPVEKAKGWAGSATIPLLPARPVAVDVFNQLESHPRLDLDEEGEWRTVPLQEFNATTDKEMDDGTQVMHFVKDPPDNYWPVYKGESFEIWNPETGTYYAWVDPDVTITYAQEKRESSYHYAGSRSPYSDMSEDWVYNEDTLPCFGPRIAFRDVARSTDTRTMIASLVPPKLFLTHKAPTLIWPRGDERDEAYLLGVLSSIPLDWYARRFVELTMSFGIFNSFPIPRPNDTDPLRQRVIELSGRLAAVDDRYSDWAEAVGVEYGPLDEETKQEKIYELDAVVAHLYGLTREHVEGPC